MIDHDTLERMASKLCHMAGGKWDRKRTKKNLWRARVLALIALSKGEADEADRVMRQVRR